MENYQEIELFERVRQVMGWTSTTWDFTNKLNGYTKSEKLEDNMVVWWLSSELQGPESFELFNWQSLSPTYKELQGLI